MTKERSFHKKNCFAWKCFFIDSNMFILPLSNFSDINLFSLQISELFESHFKEIDLSCFSVNFSSNIVDSFSPIFLEFLTEIVENVLYELHVR